MFVWRLFLTVSILVLLIGLFIFSLSFRFSLERVYLRICPFLSDCPFYWCIVACRASLIAQLVKNLPAMKDTHLVLGLGRSTGDRIGYPFQYSWASLVAQLVKNSPTMQETWVQSLGWEDPLEKGKATHSSILAWRNQGRNESHMTE